MACFVSNNLTQTIGCRISTILISAMPSTYLSTDKAVYQYISRIPSILNVLTKMANKVALVCQYYLRDDFNLKAPPPTCLQAASAL